MRAVSSRVPLESLSPELGKTSVVMWTVATGRGYHLTVLVDRE